MATARAYELEPRIGVANPEAVAKDNETTGLITSVFVFIFSLRFVTKEARHPRLLVQHELISAVPHIPRQL
jgi:hypothetical protein